MVVLSKLCRQTKQAVSIVNRILNYLTLFTGSHHILPPPPPSWDYQVLSSKEGEHLKHAASCLSHPRMQTHSKTGGLRNMLIKRRTVRTFNNLVPEFLLASLEF